MSLNRLIEEHRNALILAGNDQVRIVTANKKFWARKLNYLPNNKPLNQAYLFNNNTKGSYHPWSAMVIGEAFGDTELKELIDPIDYLYSPPTIDEFLEGMTIGMKKAADRKAKKMKALKEKYGNKSDLTDMAEMALGKGNI